MAMGVDTALAIPAAAAVAVVAVVVVCRAEGIRQHSRLVRRLLLLLAILQQRTLPSTRCRPINNLLISKIAG